MTIALSLLTAVAWGTTELLMLRAAKRLPPVTLGLWLMVLGAGLIAPFAMTSGPAPGIADLGVAVMPALIGLAGSYLYWVALRRGKLSLVSPTVSTSGGIGALIAVLALGERFGPVGVAGIVLAVVGVVVASITRVDEPTGVVWAVGAAALLGLYTVTLAISTERVGAMWSVLSYRLTGLLVLAVVAVATRAPLALAREQRRQVGGSAVLETIGFMAFTTALALGPVAVVAVVTAQFSTVAVALAALVLHERLRPHQWVGVAMMVGATSVLGALQ